MAHSISPIFFVYVHTMVISDHLKNTDWRNLCRAVHLLCASVARWCHVINLTLATSSMDHIGMIGHMLIIHGQGMNDQGGYLQWTRNIDVTMATKGSGGLFTVKITINHTFIIPCYLQYFYYCFRTGFLVGCCIYFWFFYLTLIESRNIIRKY